MKHFIGAGLSSLRCAGIIISMISALVAAPLMLSLVVSIVIPPTGPLLWETFDTLSPNTQFLCFVAVGVALTNLVFHRSFTRSLKCA